MFPNQDPNRPQPSLTPQPTQAPQQAANGQYEVVPPLPATQTSGHNPYEFIVNPNTTSRSGSKLFGGDKFIQKIVLIVGGVIVFFIVASLVLSALVPNKDITPQLTSVAQKQQELIRVAALGASQATSQTVRTFATSIEIDVTTNQTQLTSYLTAHNPKFSTSVLSGTRNAQTDTTLKEAQITNTFDAAVQQELVTELSSYQTSIKQVFPKVSSTSLKTILNSAYRTAGLLLKQSGSQASN